MFEASKLGLGLVILASAWVVPSRAMAQLAPPPSQSSGVPSASMMANPYLNPYLNPYINPLATQQPANGKNALLYMYAANSANGGLGSGRISGVRGGAAAKPKVAEMPNSVSQPGGGAARFFNPGPVNAARSGSFYNRRNRYFNNNGR